MKRLIVSFAAIGLIASPAIATTKAAANQTQTAAKAKPNKSAKRVAKVSKAAPNASKASN